MTTNLQIKLYRFLIWCLGPAFWVFLQIRARKGKEIKERLGERFGRTELPAPVSRPVWLHAISVGELLSILPVVDYLTARGFSCLVTTGTRSSAELAYRRLPQNAWHQMVPLDHPLWVGRFLEHWQPRLALMTESEIWPITFFELDDREIPLALINARISDRSYRSWRKLRGFGAAIFSIPFAVFPQSEEAAQKLTALGSAAPRMVGNLKLDAPPLPVLDEELALWDEQTKGRQIITTASLHPGEEDLVLEAFQTVLEAEPGALLCLVPRHPDKGEAMAKSAEELGLTAARWLAGETCSSSTQVWVDDRIGKLGLFYRLASLVWLGGSWQNLGGHNPVEPVLLGTPVLHGPSIHNFYEVFHLLGISCLEAASAECLAKLTLELLHNPANLKTMKDAGTQAIESHQGACLRLVNDLRKNLGSTSEKRISTE